VGNGAHFVVSELAGRSTIELKAEELGVDIDARAANEVVATLKELEHRGYHFEVADGSLEILMRTASGWHQPFFEIESYRVIVENRPGDAEGTVATEATVKVVVDGERVIATGEGNGPVNALDAALRSAISPHLPEIDHLSLADFKVRVLDAGAGTGAVTRVLIDSTNGERTWSTIGVSDNVIQASWEALVDSLVYGLLHPRQ
jgi:2-isopropylmalate synthase